MTDVTKVIEEVRELSDEEVQQLLDFLAEMKQKRREPKRGSAEALMRSLGAWKDTMTPEEID